MGLGTAGLRPGPAHAGLEAPRAGILASAESSTARRPGEGLRVWRWHWREERASGLGRRLRNLVKGGRSTLAESLYFEVKRLYC